MDSDEEFVIVFETIDATEAAIVKSLLISAEIPFLIRGEDEYEPFRGAFRGTVFNSRGRPVAFLVPATIAEEVRQLLQGTQ